MTTILITGAGSGFGRGAAIALAQLGHQVIGGAFSADEAASLSAAHPNLVGRKLDVTDADDLAAAAELEVDVLVNNAGRGQLGPLADIDIELVRQVFEVNVFGTLRVTQAIIPGMKRRGGGRFNDAMVDGVDTLVWLCTADDVPFETFKPDDILERFGLSR